MKLMLVIMDYIQRVIDIFIRYYAWKIWCICTV